MIDYLLIAFRGEPVVARSGPPRPFSLLGVFVEAEPVSRTLQQPVGLAASSEDSHSAISALQLQEQKTKPTRLK